METNERARSRRGAHKQRSIQKKVDADDARKGRNRKADAGGRPTISLSRPSPSSIIPSRAEAIEPAPMYDAPY